MAKIYPEKFDFDTAMLDAFTDSVEELLDAYDEARIPAESFAGGVRDLITLTRKVPRSVIIDVEEAK